MHVQNGPKSSKFFAQTAVPSCAQSYLQQQLSIKEIKRIEANGHPRSKSAFYIENNRSSCWRPADRSQTAIALSQRRNKILVFKYYGRVGGVNLVILLSGNYVRERGRC